MNTRRVLQFLSFMSVCIAGSASAQELSVKGSTSQQILYSQNTSTQQSDRVAVYGLSTPAPFYGIGGHFEGGYIGVRGYSTLANSSARYGGSFMATGSTGSNYGIYASASGGTSYAGYFSGNVYISGTLTQASDAKLKMNVQELPNGTLDLVLKLKPKSYRYRQNVSRLALPDGDQLGLLAQDVAAIFPALVKETTVPAADKSQPDEKVLSVDYLKLVPLLIKAVQEQQAQINDLKAQIASLKGS